MFFEGVSTIGKQKHYGYLLVSICGASNRRHYSTNES